MGLSITVDGGAVREELLRLLLRCGESAGRTEGVSQNCFASVRFVGDEEIRALNRDFRGIDRATDVLSFPAIDYPEGKTARDCPQLIAEAYDDSMASSFLGDIVISAEHAEAQAEEYGHSTVREFAYLLVHGLFHLMGYDHMTQRDKEKMRRREEETLSALGIGRDADNG